MATQKRKATDGAGENQPSKKQNQNASSSNSRTRSGTQTPKPATKPSNNNDAIEEKSKISSTQPNSRSSPSSTVIDLSVDSRSITKPMAKKGDDFPSYSNGDVYIELVRIKPHCYWLHEEVLKKCSRFFELRESEEPEEINKLKSNQLKRQGVTARYELEFSTEENLWMLVRAPMTCLKEESALSEKEAKKSVGDSLRQSKGLPSNASTPGYDYGDSARGTSTSQQLLSRDGRQPATTLSDVRSSPAAVHLANGLEAINGINGNVAATATTQPESVESTITAAAVHSDTTVKNEDGAVIKEEDTGKTGNLSEIQRQPALNQPAESNHLPLKNSALGEGADTQTASMINEMVKGVAGTANKPVNNASSSTPPVQNTSETSLAQPVPRQPSPAFDPLIKGVPRSVLEAYNSLFLMYYVQPPKLSTNDKHITLSEIELIIAIAKKYGSMRVVRDWLSSALGIYGRKVFEAIPTDPLRWLSVSIELHQAMMFREAFIHVVGLSQNLARIDTEKFEELPRTIELLDMKAEKLMSMRSDVDQKLSLTTIIDDGELELLSQPDTENYDTWLIVSIWRDWFCRHLRACMKGRMMTAKLYQQIAQGGEAYLKEAEVLQIVTTVKGKPLSELQVLRMKSDLTSMKTEAAKEVSDLVVNNSMADPKNLKWLTCADLDATELPWLP